MSLTESDLREVLAEHVHEPPGNAVRLEQVRGRIRRTRRHRQVAATGVLAVAAAAIAVGLTVPGHDTRATVTPAHPTTPPTAALTVSPTPAPSTTATPAPLPVGPVHVGRDGVAALAQYGPAMLDVTGGQTTALAPPERGDTALGLSHDGRYVVDGIGQDNSAVHVTDMTGRVLLTVTTGMYAAAWSPTSDLLAILANPTLQGSTSVTLYAITPSGGSRLASNTVSGGYYSNPTLAWSPNGTRLAIGNGHDLTFFAIDLTVAVTTSFDSAYPEPAAWSGDGSHLAVFVHSGSASIDADGVQMIAMDANGNRVGSLPESLAYPDWWHPLPGSTVLGTLGSERYASQGKTVARCDLATAHCTTLAGAPTMTSAYGGVPTADGIAYLGVTAGGPRLLLAVETNAAASSAASAAATAAGRPGGATVPVSGPAPGAPETVVQVVASADGRTLLLVGSDPSGPLSVYRYDGHTATRLTAIPAVTADVATATGYYGHVTEIVDWRQPGS